MYHNPQRLWLLSDGKPGHVRQLRALSNLLGGEIDEIILPSTGLCGALGKRLGHTLPLTKQLPPLPSNRPDIILSVANAGALAQKALMDQTPNAMRVHVMSSGRLATHLNLEIVMAHDVNADFQPNQRQILCFLTPSSGLSHIDNLPPLPELAAAHQFTLLLGGNNRAFKFTPEAARRLGNTLGKLAKQHDYGYYISPSRRTPPEALRALCQTLEGCPHFCWNGSGDNPYNSMIARAESLLVTEDSLAMQSDVVHAGKPLYLVALPHKILARLFGRHRKFARSSEYLIEKGFARRFSDDCSPFTPPACNITAELAATIQARYQSR